MSKNSVKYYEKKADLDKSISKGDSEEIIKKQNDLIHLYHEMTDEEKSKVDEDIPHTD